MDASTAKENGDSAVTDKLQIPERLLKRHQARLEDVERKKEVKESQTVSEEKTSFFRSNFNNECASIEALLSECTGADRAQVIQTLEEATTKTQLLQKFLNDSMMFLTQHQLKLAQESIQKIQTMLSEKREEALPKKKFAFRSRNNPKSMVPPDDVPSCTTPGVSEGTKVDDFVNPEQCGFSHADSIVLTKPAEEILKQDVLLTHLTNCKVRLYGSPSTLHIKHVSDCEILCGPVSSSVFVDHCTNSTLVFPCQQLRTHNTTNTKVYLHVTSRAIIEDCQGISFAPFSWSYPSLDSDFSVSGLDQNRNNWTQVDDFNWLSSGSPSPNWTVIPEPDRRICWDL